MKKTHILLIAGCLLVSSALCGCSSTGESKTSGNASEASAKTSVSAETSATEEVKETVVYDEKGIKLTYTGFKEDIFPQLTFRLENSTDKSYMVSSEDVSINDSMITTSILETIAGGKKANVNMTMLKSDLEENGIEKIEKVEFKLKITNSDDFQDSFESGVITITNP
jgi:hypothetical protein